MAAADSSYDWESDPRVAGIAQNVLREAMRSTAGNKAAVSAYDAFMGFMHAIQWGEPWMIGIVSFQVFVALLALVTRKSWTAQLILFLAICATVFGAQYINAYAAARWRDLGFTQNYFDPRGVFISFVFSTPLLLIGFGQMIYALLQSSELLIKVKRAELRQARQAAAAATGAAPMTDSAAGDAAVTAAAPAVESKKEK